VPKLLPDIVNLAKTLLHAMNIIRLSTACTISHP
jgi:hypothetical protein